LLQSPDSQNVRKALAELEFKVVIDQFMTDTASVADIILPAKDMFEQSDIIGSYWSPYVQFKPKVIDSPGEVMPESEIYYHIAQKMGMGIDSNLIPEPGNMNIEKWLEKRISGYSHLNLKDLKQGPVLAPGLQKIAWSDLIFETPSGKIELYSSEAESKWGVSPLPDYIPIENKVEQKIFPLTLITPNTGSRIHSQFGNLKIIKETVAGPAVGISLCDARVRNISSGDRIRLARVSNRIPAGSIVLNNGLWLNEGGGGNTLIAGRETDMGYGAAYHDNMVEVARVD